MTEKTEKPRAYLYKGPLSQLQKDILDRLSRGWQRAEISTDLGFSRPYISENLSAAVAKMKAQTPEHAVALWSAHRTRIQAVEEILAGRVVHPTADDHRASNETLKAAAAQMKAAARQLLPR